MKSLLIAAAIISSLFKMSYSFSADVPMASAQSFSLLCKSPNASIAFQIDRSYADGVSAHNVVYQPVKGFPQVIENYLTDTKPNGDEIPSKITFFSNEGTLVSIILPMDAIDVVHSGSTKSKLLLDANIEDADCSGKVEV